MSKYFVIANLQAMIPTHFLGKQQTTYTKKTSHFNYKN